jgi:hypothetical protein
LDINPDDADLKGAGLGAVQMTFGIPGCTVQVAAGTRVRFCYDAADPGRPRVCAFEEGAGGSTLLVTIGDPAAAHFAALSNVVNTNFNDLKTYLTSHTHPTGVGPSGPPIQPVPTPADVACTRLKVE